MSYPWNKPEDALARQAFKEYLATRVLNLNEIISSYINQPSFAYINDDDAYDTYWTAVKNDNGIR